MNLRRIAQSHGLKMTELAREMKISRQTLYRWQSCPVLPPVVRRKIEDYLDNRAGARVSAALKYVPFWQRETVADSLITQINQFIKIVEKKP